MADCVVVGDVELEYEDHGAGDVPLLLVHGYTGSRADWADHVEALAATTRVVTVDHRGHGGSTNTGHPDTYSFASLVDDLLGFLDALDIGRCDLLGHSMGGMVAMRAVLARPERFRSLVLMSTAHRPPDGISAELLGAGSEIAREQGMEALFELLESFDETDTEERRLIVERWGEQRRRERARARMTAMDAEAFAALGHELATHEPLDVALRGIGCPTTVLVGSNDRPMLGPSREMAEIIPGSRLVVIDGAWHSPQLTHPDEWRRAVLDHVEWAARG